MDSKDFINILEYIEDLIQKEKYNEVCEYISKKKSKIKNEENIASKYVDSLVKDLK